jgi:hypothetical protein
MSNFNDQGNVSSLRQFTREESRKLSDMMMAFAHSPQCAGPMSHAMSEVFGDIRSLTDDLRTAVESESCQSVFHTWFLFDRPIVRDGQTMIDVFSGNDALGLTRGQLRYLERMRLSHLRPYAVREVHRDVALVLHDLWNGEVVKIAERIATWHAEPGSSIFARVIEGPEGNFEMHGMLAFPRDQMDELLEGLRRVHGATRERLPEHSDAVYFKDVTSWIMRSWLESFRPPRRTSSNANKTPLGKRVLQLQNVLEAVKPRGFSLPTR